MQNIPILCEGFRPIRAHGSFKCFAPHNWMVLTSEWWMIQKLQVDENKFIRWMVKQNVFHWNRKRDLQYASNYTNVVELLELRKCFGLAHLLYIPTAVGQWERYPECQKHWHHSCDDLTAASANQDGKGCKETCKKGSTLFLWQLEILFLLLKEKKIPLFWIVSIWT